MMSVEKYAAWVAGRRSAYLHASKWFRIWNRVFVIFMIEWTLSAIAAMIMTGLPGSFAWGAMIGSSLSVMFAYYKRCEHEMKMYQMDDGGI